MFKKTFKIVIVLVVLIVVALVGAYFYIDHIAKRAVERGGTHAMGVDTTLSSARIGIFDGQVKLSGLNIANPEGFDADHFLDLGRGTLEVTLGTLMDDVVHVPLFRLAEIDVHLIKRQEKTNYGVILENLNRFEESGDTAPEDDADAKRFIIDEVVLRNVMVHADMLPIGGQATKIDLPLETIRLTDVGREGDRGVTIAELSDIILKAAMKAAVEKGLGILPGEIMGELQSRLNELTDLSALGIDLEADLPANINEILKQQGVNVDEILNGSLEGAGDRIGNELQNILGGDEDDTANEDDGGGRRRNRDRDQR